MVTLDKIGGRPKILTESDRILTDLSEELNQLKSRMSQLETEQEENRHLLEQVSFQEELANRLIAGQQEEIKAQRENYQVIAGVIQDLKTPVASVMENLANIIAEIDDEDTQESLRDCLATAGNVLEGFTEVEEFCLFEAGEQAQNRQNTNLRALFTDLVSRFQLQSNLGNKHGVKLLIDPKVPQDCPLYDASIAFAVTQLLAQLAEISPPGALEIKLQMAEGEMLHGVQMAELRIDLSIQGNTGMKVLESWVDFVKAYSPRLHQSGFALLKTRDRVRQSGGRLEMVSEGNMLRGFQLKMPLSF